MTTAPISDNKAATSTPVNIAVVHATQRAQIKQQILQLSRYQNPSSVPDMNQAM
jgi:hypothetical protein